MSLRRSNGYTESTSPHPTASKNNNLNRENVSPVKLNIDSSTFSKPPASAAPRKTFTQKLNKRPITVKLSDVNRPPWEVEMGIRGTYGLLMGKPKSLVRGDVLNSSVIFKSPEERQREIDEEERKKEEEKQEKVRKKTEVNKCACALSPILTPIFFAGGQGESQNCC